MFLTNGGTAIAFLCFAQTIYVGSTRYKKSDCVARSCSVQLLFVYKLRTIYIGLTTLRKLLTQFKIGTKMEQPSNTSIDTEETPTATSEKNSSVNPTDPAEPTSSANPTNPVNPADPAASPSINPVESANSSKDDKAPKKPRFQIRPSFIAFLAGALIIVGLLVNSCVFSSQVGTLSVQVNTSNPAISQVEMGVYKGIASEVLTDDKPDNDPEPLCTVSMDANSSCSISEVTEQGTYTLMVESASGEADGSSEEQFQSPKPQIVNLQDQAITVTFEV